MAENKDVVYKDTISDEWPRLYLVDEEDVNKSRWIYPPILLSWPYEEPEKPAPTMQLATVGILMEPNGNNPTVHFDNYMRYFRSAEKLADWRARDPQAWKMSVDKSQGMMYHWQKLDPYPIKFHELGLFRFIPGSVADVWKALQPTLKMIEAQIRLGPRETVISKQEASRTHAKWDGFFFALPEDMRTFLSADRIMNNFYPEPRVCTHVADVFDRDADDMNALVFFTARCKGTAQMDVKEGWVPVIGAQRGALENATEFRKMTLQVNFKQLWEDRARLFEILRVAVLKNDEKFVLTAGEKKDIVGMIDDVLPLTRPIDKTQWNALHRIRNVMLGKPQSMDHEEIRPRIHSWKWPLRTFIAAFINNMIWRYQDPDRSWRNRVWIVWSGTDFNRDADPDNPSVETEIARITYDRSWNSRQTGAVLREVYHYHRENAGKRASLLFQPEFRRAQEIKAGLEAAKEEQEEAERRGGKQFKRLQKLSTSKRRSARNYVPPRDLVPSWTRKLILSFVGSRYRAREKE